MSKKKVTKKTIKKSPPKTLTKMSAADARAFLLKTESYCGFDLPPYIGFTKLINGVEKAMGSSDLASMQKCSPRDYEGVNYTILNNKDGRHSWRAFQLIHPALYVSLVNQLTSDTNWKMIQDRFEEFADCEHIRCLSIPMESKSSESDKAEQVLNWWRGFEQRSIELALEYEYVAHADIADCYGQIYTHSISWAIHGKPFAKKKKNRTKKILGNIIDGHIQDMHHGQTNGIPQGSSLMDFIAEMVLGYADLELESKLESKLESSALNDFLILRYRDDYRIFTNSSQDAEHILKCLTEVLIDLGLKLNAGKTKASDDVVTSSIKPDKLAWSRSVKFDKNLEKHLLLIHSHAKDFPNAGSLQAALSNYYKRVRRQKVIHNVLPLVSICVDIAYRNPRTYPICAAILSQLLVHVKKKERAEILSQISKRFAKLPNTGHLEVWLQRISDPAGDKTVFNEPLCDLVQGKPAKIWENEWIDAKKLKDAVNQKLIVNHVAAKKRKPIIKPSEVALFLSLDTEY